MWEERWSRSKNRIYYLNLETQQSQWEKPENVEIVKLQVQQVRASHLLVKHKDSRKPSSWKEVLFITQKTITRTFDEAMELILQFQKQIQEGAELGALATTHSDCSSAAKGGDLGMFTKGQMQPAFEKAAFALEIGHLSDPVVSDSGIHLILRTE
jgi:NIMA-interacting peptidyl-prolyl cis-trans isomerase 1